MTEKICDWIGFVFCEAAFRLMPDDLVERCIYRATGETHADIDGYVTLSYAEYRYYDQAFFSVGSFLYQTGCFFYGLGETGHVIALPKEELQ